MPHARLSFGSSQSARVCPQNILSTREQRTQLRSQAEQRIQQSVADFCSFLYRNFVKVRSSAPMKRQDATPRGASRRASLSAATAGAVRPRSRWTRGPPAWTRTGGVSFRPGGGGFGGEAREKWGCPSLEEPWKEWFGIGFPIETSPKRAF